MGQQQATFAAIRALGLTVRKGDAEYRVAWPLDNWLRAGYSRAVAMERAEATAYYASDLDDALDTANIFWQEWETELQHCAERGL